MDETKFEALRKYLDDDAKAHIGAHGKWSLDAGKLQTALEHAGIVEPTRPAMEVASVLVTVSAPPGTDFAELVKDCIDIGWDDIKDRAQDPGWNQAHKAIFTEDGEVRNGAEPDFVVRLAEPDDKS